MKLERLQTSLAVNREASPSLHLALSLVNLLLEDMAAEAGAENVETCPSGEKPEFLKSFGRLCRTIGDIYGEKKEEIGEYPARLRGNYEKIAAMREELQKLEEEMQDYTEKIAETEALKKDLDEAKAKKNVYDVTLEQIERLKKEIAELKPFDAEAAQKTLDDLTKEKETLDEETSSFREQKTGLEEAILASKQEKEDLLAEISERMISQTDLKKEIEDKQNEKTDWERKIQTLKAQKDKANQKLETLQKDYKALEKSYDKLVTETIPHTEAVLDALKADNDAEEKKQKELQENVEKKETERDRNASELQQKEKKLTELTSAITSQNRELSELQKKIGELEGKNDSERYEKLKKQLEEKLAELHKLKVECSEMEAKIARCKADITGCETEISENTILYGDLLRKKQEVECQLREIRRKLEELSSVAGDDQFEQELRLGAEKLKFLSELSSRLLVSLRNFAEITGNSADEELYKCLNQTLAERNIGNMQRYLTELRSCIEDAVKECQQNLEEDKGL